CALHYVLVLANGDEEAAVAPPLRALHRAEHIGSAFKGGVNVCQRRLVNEVLGPLVTEFVPNFRREGATPIQRGSNASLLHRVQAIKLIVIDALISIPKHKSDKWLSKKRRSLSKKRHSRRRSVLAARDLKNSDGQTSSKNCSLNRDVECPSVGTILLIALASGQPWRLTYNCRERRPRTPPTSTSAPGRACAAR